MAKLCRLHSHPATESNDTAYLLSCIKQAIGFVRSAGYIAAILAHPIAWIAADIFLIPMYIYVMRRFKKNPPPQIQES